MRKGSMTIMILTNTLVCGGEKSALISLSADDNSRVIMEIELTFQDFAEAVITNRSNIPCKYTIY